MPSSTSKYELYQQALEQNFLREFRALVEVANGHGEFKADFTDKIFSLFGKVIQQVTDSVPAAPVILSVAELISHKVNESRKEAKSNYFLHKGFEYNTNELTVLAEQMSLAALKRYQWFVSQLDADSIIPFAKAGVERILEYLARTQLPLTLQHLLDGFIQGHSGAYMSGYFNTQLTPIDCLAKRISASKVKRAFGFTRVTAEGIYGRSGLISCDAYSSELYVHTQPDKTKAKHKNQQEQSRFDKIKDGLSKKGRESWFDYGYTKTHFEYKDEPKYGYALVSPAEVLSYFGDEESIITKPLPALESPLKDSLLNFSYEIIPFNKKHLTDYLNARNEIPDLTLLAYLKERFNAQEARLAYFDANDKNLSDLALSGAHLDNCVFDDCIFPANLTNTTLCNSFLHHADFTRVEQAQGLDLSEVHAEYLEAAGANLSYAILRSTNLLGTNLAKANLTGADILGANLIETNLKGTLSFTANLQAIQSDQEKLAAQQQLAPEEKKPEPPILSPVLPLEHIKQGLAARYQKKAVILEFAPNQTTPISLPITEKTFIHLALVAQAQQQQKERELREELKQNQSDVKETGVDKKAENQQEEPQKKSDNKSDDLQRQQLLNSWEMLSQVQEPINVNELWLEHKSDQNIPEHVLIEGSAGIGKTTLCGYIATQWSQQILWADRFDWVLWIPLRSLIDSSRYPQLANYNYSVKSFVMGECFGCLPNERRPGLTINVQDQLWQQLEEQDDRVLYVLDGYDEIAGYERKDKLDHLKAALSQLLQSKHILLTTRPQVINARSLKEQQTRRLVTLGLSDDNIPPYVENYFKAISSYSEQKQVVEEKHYDTAPLLEALKVNQTLWSISHVPLHLSLICLAYAEGKIQVSDLKQNFSLTQLYQQIVNVLLQRYLKERLKGTAEWVTAATVEHDVNTQRVTQFLEEFAFRGMAQYDLVLDETLLSESLEETKQTIEIIPALIASGFLKQVNNQGNLGYQFIHLTFQEFFAARYLARRLQKPNQYSHHWVERFHEYKHIARFAVMLWFTAGLLKNNPLSLQQFFQLLQASPQDEVGLYHLGLVMRCVAEGGYPKELTIQVSEHLGQLIKKCWIMIREGIISNNGNQEMKAQSGQLVLQWLGQQRLLTSKIEFPGSSLNIIVKDLSDQEWRIKQAAARVVGDLKTLIPEILQALVALLKDNKDNVRLAAAEALARGLGELRAPTPETLLGIVTLLKNNDNNIHVRQVAAETLVRTLGELRAPTPEILLTLVALLKNKYDGIDVRQAAAEALARPLGEFKALIPEVLQGILGLLKDNDRDIRQAGAKALVRALREFKAPTTKILQNLVDLLKDESWQAREAAALALGELKAPTLEILPTLVALVKDEKWQAREGAARALGELKAPTPEILPALVPLLKDNESSVRYCAARALGELKIPTTEILPILFTLSQDEKWQAREGAARALGELKAPTHEISPALVALLSDEKWQAREAAARALGKLKAQTPKILRALVALLKDNEKYVRQAAARALGELMTPTSEMLQGLGALLTDNDRDVRQAAAEALARALGELETPPPEISPALVALLNDEKWQAREAAARALGKLKVQTPMILRALVALLKDNERYVRQAAARALGELKAPTPEILQGLGALLTDNDRDVRQTAAEALARALGELKAPTPEILQGLVALLTHEKDYVRQAAARALGEMKAQAPEILTALVALLKDNNRDVRQAAGQAAARALGEMKAQVPEILPALVALLKDDKWDVRQAAARALGKLKAQTPKISSAIVALLKDNDSDIRYYAARALEDLKTPTPEILAALVDLLKDGSWVVRKAATQALGELKTPTPEILKGLVALLKIMIVMSDKLPLER